MQTTYALSVLFCCCMGSACFNPASVAAPPVTEVTDTLPLPILTAPPPQTLPYADTRLRAAASRQTLQKALAEGTVDLDSVRRVFSQLLAQQIIPYWYGTTWSFEGHTETPGNGHIACGYFVSTTLRDLGLPVNRYKLAQQAPADEAKMLSYGEKIHYFSGQTAHWMHDTLSHYLTRDGVYFIGLSSSHVGYLLREKGQFYAIHANYYPPNTVVVRQPLNESVYRLFSEIYIVPLTWNDGLVKAWVTGKVR